MDNQMPKKKQSLLNSYMDSIVSVKSEFGCKDIGVSKDFLFDPYAAAYYSRFSDFNPQKHNLKEYLSLT